MVQLVYDKQRKTFHHRQPAYVQPCKKNMTVMDPGYTKRAVDWLGHPLWICESQNIGWTAFWIGSKEILQEPPT